MAVLDEDKIIGDILIRIGEEEPYEGIGRGNINIKNIPVYCDQTSIRHELELPNKQVMFCYL